MLRYMVTPVIYCFPRGFAELLLFQGGAFTTRDNFPFLGLSSGRTLSDPGKEFKLLHESFLCGLIYTKDNLFLSTLYFVTSQGISYGKQTGF